MFSLDLVRDLRAREHRHPGGGKLNAQRQPLDQPADATASARCVLIQRKARLDLPRALDEEAQCAGAPVPVLREAEAVDVEHPLALHGEALTRRRQKLDVRCALDDLAQETRTGRPGARSCRARAASTARADNQGAVDEPRSRCGRRPPRTGSTRQPQAPGTRARQQTRAGRSARRAGSARSGARRPRARAASCLLRPARRV